MKRILIIEDDKKLAAELEYLLNTHGYDADKIESFTGNIVDDVIASRSDLILLDINLPFESGETILKNLRKTSNIPVIMLTSKVGEIDEVLSLSYGADDYITKPYNPTILLLHIEAILKRTMPKQDIINYKGVTINLNKSSLTDGTKEIPLTKSEMIIFKYLLDNQNKIVSRDALMTALWDNDDYINDNALTVNISRLRGKLETFHIEKNLETRKGQGYILL